MRRERHSADVLEAIRALPAEAIGIASRRSGYWVSTIWNPEPYVSDAVPCLYGKTESEALDAVKAWLLDDLACEGKLGKPQYQPHWDRYDILYRLIPKWKRRD